MRHLLNTQAQPHRHGAHRHGADINRKERYCWICNDWSWSWELKRQVSSSWIGNGKGPSHCCTSMSRSMRMRRTRSAFRISRATTRWFTSAVGGRPSLVACSAASWAISSSGEARLIAHQAGEQLPLRKLVQRLYPLHGHCEVVGPGWSAQELNTVSTKN